MATSSLHPQKQKRLCASGAERKIPERESCRAEFRRHIVVLLVDRFSSRLDLSTFCCGVSRALPRREYRRATVQKKIEIFLRSSGAWAGTATRLVRVFRANKESRTRKNSPTEFRRRADVSCA